MSIIVQKYGGTSVENKEKLEVICNKIISYVNRKHKMVIVVSAQGKTTDRLVDLAYTYSDNPDKRDMDILLSTGEMQTVALLSMMLKDKGYRTVGLSGEQAGIISNSNFGSAKIETIYTDNIMNYLNNNYIVIVAGFQAIDRLGYTTTLGRGGSDLSAVAIASCLKAKRCEIYTDVDGVFSSDPKIVTKAKLLKKISYDEMLEAATSGAKVLHDRSVNLAKKHSLKISVKNTLNNSKGSSIQKIINNEDQDYMLEDNEIKFISKKDNLTKIAIIGDMIIHNKDILPIIFTIAKKLDIPIYMVSFSELSINILVDTLVSSEFMQELHKELIEKATE